MNTYQMQILSIIKYQIMRSALKGQIASNFVEEETKYSFFDTQYFPHHLKIFT